MGARATSADRRSDQDGMKASPSKSVLHLASGKDAMHALLVKRADEFVGCIEGSPKEAELASLVDVIDAYEARR
jgi:hypothetical protein